MCKPHIMLNLLDPLFAAFARLTVARGILFSDLTERLKPHYIEAARSIGDGKITDSRLSVLTGLQRRDIVRLRGRQMTTAQRQNHLTRLVALWQNEPGYHRDGKPLALPKNGPAPSFEALARIVRRDIHPRTMLDALEASETVRLDTRTQTVNLLKSSYRPLAGSEDQLSYLAHNFADHLAAATENVLGRTPRHFERAVHYGGLTASQVARLRAEYASGQMALLEALSARASAMKKQNADQPAPHRFRAGGYFYETEETHE